MAQELPEWWVWELELTSHLLKRMVDRSFSEVDLRIMMEAAGAFRPSEVEGRYIIETRHNAARWEIVVEPDTSDKVLVVVTAYEVTIQS
jgi:hypothetical protein